MIARVLSLGLLLIGTVTAADAPRGIKVFKADPIITTTEAPVWTPDQTPADFLDSISLRVKMRWRQHYREKSPAPASQRPISAFTLGTLIAEGHIAFAAQDGQHFRDNNQDILSYCRVLGLTEKMAPLLLAQAKLAEAGNWSELRQHTIDAHLELGRVLREQRDNDLAVLVELGLWLRLIDVVSATVMANGDPTAWPLAIGAPTLLHELKSREATLTDTTRQIEAITSLAADIAFLCRQWTDTGTPSEDRMTKTRTKIDVILRRLSPK
jgi:hypothetical protein